MHFRRYLTRCIDLYINTYGFGVGLAGLAYIGLGLGFVAATIFGVKVGDVVYHRVRSPFFR